MGPGDNFHIKDVISTIYISVRSHLFVWRRVASTVGASGRESVVPEYGIPNCLHSSTGTNRAKFYLDFSLKTKMFPMRKPIVIFQGGGGFYFVVI